MPLWASVFLPVVITIIVQLISFWLSSNLEHRAREELNAEGITDITTHNTAIYIGQSLALLLGMYGGLLPVVGALAIAALGKLPLDPIAITVIFGVLSVVAFILFPLIMSTRLGDLSIPFSNNPAHWSAKAIKKLKFNSYGSFINVLLILITSGILFYIAYLQLP